jgi:hypothetical protein
VKDFNASLNEALKYATDADTLRRMLTEDPDHLTAGSILRRPSGGW